MTFEVQLTIYIVAASLAASLYLLWVLWGPIQRFCYRHWTIRFYYKTVKQVVLDHDLYLINQFHNKTAGKEDFHIDHIIIGEKYIYAIRDRYYDGTLQANPENEQWVYYRGKSKKYIPNPYAMNRFRADRLCLLLGPIDPDIVIPIVVVNNDCYFSDFPQDNRAGYFISLSRLGKLIADRENDDVDPLEPLFAERLAKDLHDINIHD